MRRSTLLIIVALALPTHLLLLGLFHVPHAKPPWGDEEMYLATASAILESGRSPMELLWPPLYPWFLAACLWLGGGTLIALQAVQTLLLGAVAWLARDLWRRLVGPGVAGDVLALALLVYPPLVAYAHYLWPEVLHLALFTFAAWILVARPRRTGWAVLLGAVLGAALLTKSVLGPVLPLFLVPVALDGGWRRGLPRAALVVAVIAGLLLPVMLSNRRDHGVFAVASSGKFNLWVGLNDVSRQAFVGEVVGREYRRYQRSAADTAGRDGILSEKIASLVAERGLARVAWERARVQYFRLFERESFLTSQLRPGAIWQRGKGYREAPRFLSTLLRGGSHLMYGSLLVLGFLGVFVCPPRGRRFMVWILAFLAYNLVIFTVLHVNSRYRVPFIPLLMFYAVLFVDRLVARLRGTANAQEAPIASWRWVAGSTAAAAALFFAFGGSLLD